MRPAPVVTDGARGPEQNPQVGAPGADSETGLGQRIKALGTFAVKAADGEVVFRSRYHGYRIQVTAPSDTYNMATGQFVRARPVFAQFRQGEYRSKDSAIISALKAGKEYGSEYWDAAEVGAKAKEAALNSLIREVTGSPELRDRLLQELASAEYPDAQPKPTDLPPRGDVGDQS